MMQERLTGKEFWKQGIKLKYKNLEQQEDELPGFDDNKNDIKNVFMFDQDVFDVDIDLEGIDSD